MLSVIMLNVVMLSVAAILKRRVDYAVCQNVWYHYAECHYAECRYAECRDAKNVLI